MLQAILAMGLLAALAMWGGSAIVNRFRSVAASGARHDADLLFREMVDHLSFQGTCTRTFANSSFTDGIITARLIVDRNSSREARYQSYLTNSDAVYAGGQLKIRTMGLQGFRPTTEDPDDPSGSSRFFVEFERTDKNSLGGKILRREAEITVVMSSRDPAFAKVVDCHSGGEPAWREWKYPAGCKLYLGHHDTGGGADAKAAEVSMLLNRPGYMGLRLDGDVDDNDLLWIRGQCPGSAAGSLEKYFEGCRIHLGIRDKSEGKGNDEPARRVSPPIAMDGVRRDLQPENDDDVDENDTVYFAMSCPSTTSPDGAHAQYLKNNCALCFGWSDELRPQPLYRACTRVALEKDPAASPSQWAKFMFHGNVDANDMLFLGFFCGPNHSEVRCINYRRPQSGWPSEVECPRD